ncbi:E3 ubiquitin-protein ligase BRE1-like 1 [Nymphaea colorata]|nr:E3 ubiquitin-protein ligase BRE1-like 1 [Nymphaea colorata]
MGSTGEPDRKRRHFSAISPNSTKKHPLLPFSEDKKIDAAVLEFKNQKLLQQLEAQKVEFAVLDDKFSQLKAKQQDHDSILLVVNTSWEQLVDELESMSIHTSGTSNGTNGLSSSQSSDGASCRPEDSFLCRLLETGATDTSSPTMSSNQMEDYLGDGRASTKTILKNIVMAIHYLETNDNLFATLDGFLPNDESSKQFEKTVNDLRMEVRSLKVALGDLHLKHRSLSNEVYSSRDTNAKNKLELKRLTGELESTISELEESNRKLALLKAQRDSAQGAVFPVLNIGAKHASMEKIKEKPRDFHDMESAVKESSDLASSRLEKLRSAHEEKINVLRQLQNLQASLKDLKHITSSNAFRLLSNELEESKAQCEQYQALMEKLQAEKDNFAWGEKEIGLKVDIAEVSKRAAIIAESRIDDLEKEIERQTRERDLLEIKLVEAAKEPGRRDIIADFKVRVSSLHKDMDMMQTELNKYKEAALDIHSLRAEVQSLSNILKRKVNELEILSDRSDGQIAEIKKLQALVSDLRESDQELKLILEMYRRESTDPRDIIDARDSEYKAWAHVQSLKSALDEHSLELRVKAANEAEAISQQRLATAEAEIADLRQRLEASQRELVELTEGLKSKNEASELYLSEIETIGQAYEDMQTQNQHLLQQITERDDYNIKLVIEGVRAKQLRDALLVDKQSTEKEVLQVQSSLDFYKLKALRIEEQAKTFSEQIGKLAEDGWQSSTILENCRRRILDSQRESHWLKQTLDESQSKLQRLRTDVSEIRVGLESEQFKKKRIIEELEVLERKEARLCARTDSGSSVLEKLQDEIDAYEAILKCNICNERRKEVVIAKCYHLFCHPCIQRTLENRQRKCSICGASFGPNDVLKVYF